MSTRGGNDAWKALSDTHNSKGQFVSPEPDAMVADEPPVVVPSVLTKWFVQFRADILAGRVSLEQIIDATDADMQDSQSELCPDCGRRAVRDHRTGRASYQGVCATCWLYRLRDKHLERLAELEAQTACNQAKQRVRRQRDEMDPDRQRVPRLMRPCDSCGRPFAVPLTVNPDESRCITCRERDERRHSEEVTP
jgi:hypothetical protein